MIFTIITMTIIFFSCYTAGKLNALLDIDRIDGKPFNTKIALIAVCNALIGIYSIVALYGQGIERGLQ